MKPILAVISGFLLSFGMFVGGIFFALFVIVDEPPQRPSTANANMTEVWAGEPRTVDREAQNFERVPAVEQADHLAESGAGAAAAAAPAGHVEPGVDTTTTAAVPPRAGEPPRAAEPTRIGGVPRAAEPALVEEPQVTEPTPEDQAAGRLLTEHTAWCSRRYRSYDAGTNTYSSFRGGRRQCLSPYWAEYAALTREVAPADGSERVVPAAEDQLAGEIIAPDESGTPQRLDYVDESIATQGIGPAIDDQHVRDCFSRYRSYRPEDNTYQPFGGGPRRQCR